MPCVVTSPGPWQPPVQGPGVLDGAHTLPVSELLSGPGPEEGEGKWPLGVTWGCGQGSSPGLLSPWLSVPKPLGARPRAPESQALCAQASGCQQVCAQPHPPRVSCHKLEPPRKGPGQGLGHSRPRQGSRSREPQEAGIQALRFLHFSEPRFPAWKGGQRPPKPLAPPPLPGSCCAHSAGDLGSPNPPPPTSLPPALRPGRQAGWSLLPSRRHPPTQHTARGPGVRDGHVETSTELDEQRGPRAAARQRGSFHKGGRRG